MRKRFFVSYSSKDSHLIESVATKLSSPNVFLDKWDLEAGTPLPLTLAEAVDTAAAFVLFLSKNSAMSNWVKFELNVAIARHIEDSGYRILLVKLDSSPTPPAVRHFQHKDVSSTSSHAVADEVAEWLLGFKGEPPETGHALPLFLDRHSEQARVEQLLSEGAISVLCLTGLFGIGKRTLAQHLCRQLFGQEPIVCDVGMLGPTALAWSLYTPSLGLPNPDTIGVDSTETVARYIQAHREKRKCLVLTSIESLLEDETATPLPLLNRILDRCFEDQNSAHPPLILTTRRAVRLPADRGTRFHKIWLEGLPPAVMPELLRRWIWRVNQNLDLSQTQLLELTKRLMVIPLQLA